MWIFGYGSLMWDGWEESFSCTRRLVGELHGYLRAFNKASVRNWGTKSNPGPTLNLEVADHGLCCGIAFEFPDTQSSRVMGYLEEREGKSFAFKALPVLVRNVGEVTALVPMYEGKNLIGTSNVQQLARQILTATGKSGGCRDYVRGVHVELLKLGIDDPVVKEIWNTVDASH